MIDKIHYKQEALQSGISYTAGGGLIGLASFQEIAQEAQEVAQEAQEATHDWAGVAGDWAIILGCLVVAVRLIHDVIALCRFIKQRGN